MAAAAAPARYDNVNLLRAFAALAVVVYHVIEHARWTGFPGDGPWSAFRMGWLGVDLFFVISGFVISYSALVLHRKSRGDFARTYWARRLARILPLYLLTLVLWIACFWSVFRGMSPRDWAIQLGSHLTFTHNIWPATHGAIDGPNWSLGIEMQFYLLVALAIGWLDRTPGWRIWLYAILVSWAYRYWAVLEYSGQGAGVLFVKSTQLPGVLDLFGAGIFLAKRVLDGPAPRRMAALGWAVGAVATGAATFAIYHRYSGYWDVPAMVVFWRTPLAVFFLALLALAVRLPGSIARRGLKPLDYLGEVSYGIYLWHLFFIAAGIALFGTNGPRVMAFALPTTVAAAALSWHLFEKPFMRLARR